MDAAATIQDAVARVVALRAHTASAPDLKAAASAIKALQARRFAGTYADVLTSEVQGGAARFFLEELYSERDYAERDAQFARIAGPLQRFFPQRVVGTAVAMACLHALTEELDHAVAIRWLELGPQHADDAARYIAAWRAVGRADDRALQLRTVLEVGEELERLVRLPGLRLTLRMMRRPAHAAGLSALQAFLEAGFDTFAGLVHGDDHGAGAFLDLIRRRETAWMDGLFHQELQPCCERLQACLDKRPSAD